MEQTIIGWLRQRAAQTPERPALCVKAAGEYHWTTWRDVHSLVLRTAVALRDWGIEPGDRVAQWSENRLEWIVCDLALQWLAAVHVPLHANLPAEQAAIQILHSGATRVLVSGAAQLEKLRSVESQLPRGLACLAFDECDGQLAGHPVLQLASLVPPQLDPRNESELTDRAQSRVASGTLATILYTSGTSGGPKGVMLTHGNLASNAAATWPATGERADDLKLAFLPLSHIFARTCDLYVWIACGNRLALAETRETVLDDCQRVRPTWINAVPYFYDKLCQLAGTEESAAARLRELLGGQIRSCQCGGAAVQQTTFDFFWQHGVPLFPGYGLTEASPVVSVSAPDAVRWGAVGRPPAGVEVRLADDGEILTRGPHVMQGYWQDEAATTETIRDGWLYTGDLGAWDEHGLLQIRGRKKELIVTATGHKIQPGRLEMLLVQDPRIEQAFVTGDARGFPIALIVPQPLGAADDDHRLEPELRQRIDARLAGLSPYEQIRRFAVLPRPLSMEHGELTPKASLRRAEIVGNWSALLESLGRPADLPPSPTHS
jgi:long-chain acyl-CoA synthetase